MKLLTADIRKKLLRNGKLRQQREQEGKPEPDFCRSSSCSRPMAVAPGS